MLTLAVDSHDADTGLDILRTLFGSPVEMVTDPGVDFSIDAHATVDESFSFGSFSLGFGGSAVSEAFNTYMLATALHGGRFRWNAGESSGGPSTPVIILPGQRAEADFDRITMVSANVAAPAVEAVLHDWDHGPASHLNPSAGAGSQLVFPLLNMLAETFDIAPENFDNPLTRSSFEQLTIAALLASDPSLTESPVHRQATATRAVRRAMSYIDEHFAGPVAVADIAAAARMSVRALQYSFKREIGVAPMQYLRSRRLAAARAELVSAEPAEGETIAVISARWGFTHPARFAAAYRDEFGEYPGQTLRH